MKLIQTLMQSLRTFRAEADQRSRPIPTPEATEQLKQILLNRVADAESKRKAEKEELERFPILPTDDPDILEDFVRTHPQTFMAFYYKKMRKAIMEDASRATLFRVSDANTAYIPRDKYVESLTDLIDKAYKLETYEFIKPFNELIDKAHVNRVIEESR
jgi:hypothetical protein